MLLVFGFCLESGLCVMGWEMIVVVYRVRVGDCSLFFCWLCEV